MLRVRGVRDSVRVKGIYFFIWFGYAEVLPLFVFITILNINDICILSVYYLKAVLFTLETAPCFSTVSFIPVLEVSFGDKRERGSAPQISSLSSLNLTLGEASKNAQDRDKYQQEIVFRVWDEAEPKASQAEEF